jgi:hypothetical protein
MHATPPDPERETDDPLDRLLRVELHWEAPPDLTVRLLSLIPDTPQPYVPPIRSASHGWYSRLVLLLTMALMTLSLAIAWWVYGTISAELGLTVLIEQLRSTPQLLLQQLYLLFPALHLFVDLLASVQDQLHWLLLAMILWLAADSWQPVQRGEATEQASLPTS